MSNKKWGFLITGSDGEAVFTEAEVVEKSKFDELQSALDGLFANPHVGLETLIYSVRDRELKGWDGKWVKQWGDAVSAAEKLANKPVVPLWWCSFADGTLPQGEQFLGVAIIRANNIGEAAIKAHALKINPGGELQGVQIPTEGEARFLPFENKLLLKPELEKHFDDLVILDAEDE